MSARFQAVLHYDGTAYRGWQRQADAVTVQAACERALAGVLGDDIRLIAAGRTDTGVHARGQVVHFDHGARIGPEELRRAWNARLPEDIWAERLAAVPSEFHARHHATARTYRYFVAQGSTAPSPFISRYAWVIERPLDWPKIESLTELLVGTHDFSNFSKGVGGMCRVYRAAWVETPAGRALEITADRFLRHMVRALVGVLIAIGRHRLTADDAARALTPAGPRAAAAYAPPRGLFLWKVEYP